MDEYVLSDYGELLYAIDRALDSEIFNLHDPPYRYVRALRDILCGLDRLRTHFPNRPHPPFRYADLGRAAQGRVDALRALTDEALSNNPAVYMNRRYDPFDASHHLLRAFFDSDFDVNTSRIPPLFFTPARDLRLLFWARPEIRDRPFAFFPDAWIFILDKFHGATALQLALHERDRERAQLLVSSRHGAAAVHTALTHCPPNFTPDEFADLHNVWREFFVTPAYDAARALPPGHALDALHRPR